MFRTRIFHASSALAIALTVSGCVQIDTIDQAKLNTATSEMPKVNDASSAKGYIYAARTELNADRTELRDGEGVLGVGIAGGAMAVILGGALNWSSKAVIGASAVSGASYAGAQTYRPRAQMEIIDASLAALDCMDARAEVAYPGASTRALVLQPVINAQQDVARDLEAKGLSSEALMSGKAAIKVGDDFINSNQSLVFQQVRTSVDKLITATNTQLTKATADPTEIQKAFSAISVAKPSGQSPDTPPKADLPSGVVAARAARDARDKLLASQSLTDAQSASVALTAEQSALIALGDHIDVLNRAITKAKASQDKLPADTGVLDLNSCLPGAVVLTVSPSGPITLGKSQKYELTIKGGQHAWSWSGVAPQTITVTQRASNVYSLETSASLGANETYILTFTPYADGAAQTVTINTN